MMMSRRVDIMYRSLVVSLTAAVVVVAMTTPVAAQGRGYHHGTIFRATPPLAPAGGPAFIGRPPAPVVAPRVHAAPFGFARYPRTIIVPPVVGYYSPYVWPAASLFAAPAYSPYVGPVYSEPAYVSQPPPPAVSPREVDLAYQVGRLSQEIDQLRLQQNLRSSPPPPQTQSAPERPPIPTVRVFRDGHRMEIQNYAIVGQTLWVLDEKAAAKISIADLDLDATQKENRERGLRFPLPER